MQISDFSDVIYLTSKNELTMWLDRNTEELNSFSPQKLEVNACSSWSGFIFRFTDIGLFSETSTDDIPPYEAKELRITHSHTCP